jgi:molybdopterin-guanine dinucleotide biosynthesis protein A
MRDPLSAAILAGGNSMRMQEDKAFLKFRDRSFVELIYDEMSKVASDVLVIVSQNGAPRFRRVLGESARIVQDSYSLRNPMGGMLSACSEVKSEHVAFIACDLPLVRSEVVSRLLDRALGHSAAVPRWKNGDLEPLCAVYNVEDTKRAGLKAMEANLIGCRNLISFLSDVVYVSTNELHDVDPDLRSFLNINSKKDLAELSRMKE